MDFSSDSFDLLSAKTRLTSSAQSVLNSRREPYALIVFEKVIHQNCFEAKISCCEGLFLILQVRPPQWPPTAAPNTTPHSHRITPPPPPPHTHTHKHTHPPNTPPSITHREIWTPLSSSSPNATTPPIASHPWFRSRPMLAIFWAIRPT